MNQPNRCWLGRLLFLSWQVPASTIFLPAFRAIAEMHIFTGAAQDAAAVSEWTNLILRWTHVLAGIFWIGQTYYFTELEGRMALDEGGRAQLRQAPAGMDGAQRQFLARG